MTLEEFTGKKQVPQIPQTAKEVEAYIQKLLATDMTVDIFLDKIATLLALIGEEQLDSTKIIGQVGYKGSPLIPEWEHKPNQIPFYVKDPLTEKSVPDPRVIYIGRFIYKMGKIMENNGHGFMYELYVRTAQRIHCFISPLNDAWTGIGTWNFE